MRRTRLTTLGLLWLKVGGRWFSRAFSARLVGLTQTLLRFGADVTVLRPLTFFRALTTVSVRIRLPVVILQLLQVKVVWAGLKSCRFRGGQCTQSTNLVVLLGEPITG